MVGNTGDGKSHTLNHAFCGGQEVFKTSSSQTTCTLGVWAAFEPERVYLLLDTEGKSPSPPAHVCPPDNGHTTPWCVRSVPCIKHNAWTSDSTTLTSKCCSPSLSPTLQNVHGRFHVIDVTVPLFFLFLISQIHHPLTFSCRATDTIAGTGTFFHMCSLRYGAR